MNRAAIVLAVVSALGLGASFGFMGGVLFSRHIQHGGPHSGFNGRGGGMRQEEPGRMPHERGGLPSPRALLPRLRLLLDLTPEQAVAIRDELESSRGQFDQVRDSLHMRIERHLTSVQRDRFRHMMNGRGVDEKRGLYRRTLRAVPGREGDTTR